MVSPYSIYKAMFCSGSGLRGDASTCTAETEITSASKRKKLRLELLGETQPDASSRVSHEIEHYLTLQVPIEFEDNPLAFWQHYENNSFPLLSKVDGTYHQATRSSIGPEKLKRVLFVHDNFEFATNECSS